MNYWKSRCYGASMTILWMSRPVLACSPDHTPRLLAVGCYPGRTAQTEAHQHPAAAEYHPELLWQLVGGRREARHRSLPPQSPGLRGKWWLALCAPAQKETKYDCGRVIIQFAPDMLSLNIRNLCWKSWNIMDLEAADWKHPYWITLYIFEQRFNIVFIIDIVNKLCLLWHLILPHRRCTNSTCV